MATLQISEFGGLTRKSTVQIAMLPAIAIQELTIGAEVKSAAFSSSTLFIRVKANAACAIKEGSNPTATTADLPLDAGETEYFGVTPGNKLSVILRTP